jgi:hypothetical protein
MLWEHVKAGLFDELAKISAVDLRGLAPETLMAQQPPQPMMTEGYNKAKAILDRAQMMKISAVSRSSRQVQRALPGQPGLGKMINQGDNSTSERAKSVVGYGLAGASTGGLLHKGYSMLPHVHESLRKPGMTDAAKYMAEHKVNNLGFGLMAGGAALGTGYGAYRAHKKAQQARMTKTSNLSTPGMQLKGTQQVGKPSMAPHVSGPSATSQIGGSLIGRKFTPGATQ